MKEYRLDFNGEFDEDNIDDSLFDSETKDTDNYNMNEFDNIELLDFDTEDDLYEQCEYENRLLDVEDFYDSNEEDDAYDRLIDFNNSDHSKNSSKQSGSKKKNYTSLAFAHELLRHTNFLSIKGVLYAFNGEYYEKVDKDDVVTMIKEIYTPEELEPIKLNELKDTAEQLISQPEIRFDRLEAEKGLVLFNNGMFDIRTGRMVEGPPKRFCIHKVDADYGRREETPNFDHFLEMTSHGDAQIKRLILTFLGYCLIPDLDGKCFFVLGTARDSGKSMLARFLQKLIGTDTISNISLHEFHETFGIAPIVGKVLNISMDICGGKLNNKDLSYLKMLTGEDRVMINDKHIKRVPYQNIAKLIFGTNKPISLYQDDDAFWERLIIIPFKHSVPKEEQDKDLFDKIWNERNGIVYKAMQAAAKLIRNKYVFPKCDASDRMKNVWRNMEFRDVIYFVEDWCDLSDEKVRTRTVDLYEAYLKYCEENFETPRGRNSFAVVLKEKYGLEPVRKAGSNGQFRGLKGIRLKSQGGDTP